MTEDNNGDQKMWGTLPCGCIAYRAVTESKLVDKRTGRVSAGAFIRRKPTPEGKPRDVKGLSVAIYPEELLSVEEATFRLRNNLNCYAIRSLHVGRVRDIRTDPQLDIIRNEITHANIEGLPEYGTDDAKAERLAGILLKQSRPVWNKYNEFLETS